MSKIKGSEVKVLGSSINIPGDGLPRIFDYAADVIGLIGEPAGIISDNFRAFREKRRIALQLTLARAAQMSNDMAFIEKKPLKLLAPIFDGMSREDIEGENLSEIWAKFLVNCPDTFDSIAAAAIDCLSRIGLREAQLLQSLASQTALYDEGAIGSASGQNIYNVVESKLEGAYRDLFAMQSGRKIENNKSAEEFIEFCKLKHRNFYIRGAGYCCESRNNPIVSDSIYISRDSMLILSREGLVWEIENSKRTANLSVWISSIRISDFGIKFLDLMQDNGNKNV